MELSRRAKEIKTSPTLFLVAKAKELASKGHPVISLTVGEPDWPTFSNICKSGIEAIEKGVTKYTPANGNLDLRQAICVSLSQDLKLDYKPTEVMVGPGAKFVIFSALQMLCNEGDEVIIPSPYWVSYPTMVELADARADIIFCDEAENFKLDAKTLDARITSKTKAILFCSPSNPTGLFYSAAELKSIGEVLKKHPNVWIISDDIYNRLVFNDDHCAPHLLQQVPDLKNRCLLVNGGSKSFSMTGWRIGWAAGPEILIKAMGDYQSQATGAPSSIAQYAMAKNILTNEHEIQNSIILLKKRKQAAMENFKKIPQFKVYEPDGAFYLWVNIKSVLGKKFQGTKIENDKMFCDILLDKFYVATVPGMECGNNGYMRLSFAISEDKMKEAIGRIAEFVNSLS